MATIGSLQVELGLDGSDFSQNMSKVRQELRTTGTAFHTSERQIASFAAKGFGAAIPAAEGFEHSMQQVIQSATRAGGALRLLGQAGIVVGGALAVAAGVQWLQDNIKNWMRFGETVSATLERLKTEAEETKKHIDLIQRAGAIRASLASQQIQADTNRSATVLRLMGDERGALEAEFQGRLRLQIEERKADEDRIRRAVPMGALRTQLLLQAEQVFVTKRGELRAAMEQAVLKLQEQESATQIKKWQEETNALRNQLQIRVDLRRRIEEAGAAAAEAEGLGAIFAPLDDTEQTRGRMEAIAARFAQDIDIAGGPRDFFERMLKLDEQFQARGFPGFITAVENARVKLRDFGADTFGLNTELGRVGPLLAAIPAGVNAADPAIQAMTRDFAALKNQIAGARGELEAFNATVAPGAQASRPALPNTGFRVILPPEETEE